jgi:hypothetical protein
VQTTFPLDPQPTATRLTGESITLVKASADGSWVLPQGGKNQFERTENLNFEPGQKALLDRQVQARQTIPVAPKRHIRTAARSS